jgi:hypothetical protein
LLGVLTHAADLGDQRLERTLAFLLDRPQLGLDPAQGLPQRCDQALDRLLALGQVTGGLGADLSQPGLGQPHERLVVAGQCLGGQGCEGLAQQLFTLPLVVQRGGGAGEFCLGCPGLCPYGCQVGPCSVRLGPDRVTFGDQPGLTGPAESEPHRQPHGQPGSEGQ